MNPEGIGQCRAGLQALSCFLWLFIYSMAFIVGGFLDEVKDSNSSWVGSCINPSGVKIRRYLS